MGDRYPKQIEYSQKYFDDEYEYRHVILTKEISDSLPKERFAKKLTENQWRNLGVQQSRGWVHYTWHKPEPHILLFRRLFGTDGNTGDVDPVLKQQMKAELEQEMAELARHR